LLVFNLYNPASLLSRPAFNYFNDLNHYLCHIVSAGGVPHTFKVKESEAAGGGSC
jgi:hypothetical protein